MSSKIESITSTKPRRTSSLKNVLRAIRVTSTIDNILQKTRSREESAASDEARRTQAAAVEARKTQAIALEANKAQAALRKDPIQMVPGPVIVKPRRPSKPSGWDTPTTRYKWSSSYVTTSVNYPPVQPFRFLDLPGELRNQIYEEICVLPQPIFLGDKGRHHAAGHPPSLLPQSDAIRHVLRFLMTNKRIRAEALPYFYRHNTFEVSHSIAKDALAHIFPIVHRTLLRSFSTFWAVPDMTKCHCKAHYVEHITWRSACNTASALNTIFPNLTSYKVTFAVDSEHRYAVPRSTPLLCCTPGNVWHHQLMPTHGETAAMLTRRAYRWIKHVAELDHDRHSEKEPAKRKIRFAPPMQMSVAFQGYCDLMVPEAFVAGLERFAWEANVKVQMGINWA